MKTQKHRMKFKVFAFIMALMLAFWLIPAGTLFGADIITVSNHQGQMPDSSWTSGNVSGYKDGDTINFRFDFTASAAGSGSLDVKFSKVGNKGFDFFLGSFNHYDTTGNTAEGTVAPSGGVVADGGDWVQTLDVVFTAAGTVTVYYQLQLSDDAGQNDGASTQSQLASSAIPGDVHEPGSQTVPVPARDVLQVDDITIYKHIDDSIATVGTFGFTWSGGDGTSGAFDLGPAVYSSILTVIEGVEYTITETTLEPGYAFLKTVRNGTEGFVNPIVFSATDSVDPNIYFHNYLDTGTIIVHKNIVAPDGSEIVDSTTGFTVQLNGADQKPVAEGTDATYNNVASGTHTITEDTVVAGYVLDSITPDGDGITPGAQVTVVAGETTEVWVTNKQTDATITIHKDVRAPDGSDVSDSHSFTVKRDGVEGKTIAEGTDAVYSVAPGTYTFTEDADGDYTLDSITGDDDAIALNGATVTVGSGESKELTFVNKQMKATITIVKDVRDPGGYDISDNNIFTVRVGGSDPKNFAEGSNAQYQLDPGQYVFTEDAESGYTLMGVNPDNNALASDGTTQTLTSNQSLTITFTNYQDYGSVSGTKYEDEDGSLGTTDDQTGIENWWVYLYQTTSDYTGGTLFDSLQTESDGSFNFASVIPGYYQLTEEIRTGWKNLTSWFLNFMVGPGEDVVDKDFVNFQNVTIVVHKNILAPDGSEVIDSTSGFSVLIDGGDKKAVDESTNAIYDDLEPGTYTISEDDIPAGYLLYSITPDESGAPGAQITVSSGATIDVYVVNKQTEAIITIHKNVIASDGSETTDLKDFTVQKDGGENETIAEGTDAVYTVFPGTYTFTELTEAGYTLDSITGDDDGTASNGATVEVSSGEKIELTFVNKQAPPPALGSIGDYVWRDGNRNGVWDSGEFGLDDVTVYLSGPVNQVTLTDANGFYLFTGLPSGAYTITIDTGDPDIPAGSTFTTPDNYIVVLAGGIVLYADFGLMSAGPEPFLEVLALTGFDLSYYIAGFLLIFIGGIGAIYLSRLLRRKEE